MLIPKTRKNKVNPKGLQTRKKERAAK